MPRFDGVVFLLGTAIVLPSCGPGSHPGENPSALIIPTELLKQPTAAIELKNFQLS
jgi:hypothetical protein